MTDKIESKEQGKENPMEYTYLFGIGLFAFVLFGGIIFFITTMDDQESRPK